ncbi:hypothetical protein [Nakamurella endophytica]|uniref:hypothetical protein n=1 Tax=Nakamurella endophytica TaxID=1748367 RepID=UPI00166EC652|nr:hypothetical protein [Nakamurella endophytica]
MGKHWRLTSLHTAGYETDAARFPDAAVEFTATFLAYDLYCSGALHTYTAAGDQLTPGRAVDTMAHACGPTEVGPVPDAMTAVFESATPVHYEVTARTLTVRSPTVTLVFRNAGRAGFYGYWPQLYPNSDLAAWVHEPATAPFPASFRRPQQWQPYPFRQSSTDRAVARYLGTDPPQNPCGAAQPNRPAVACGPPIHRLSLDGVLVTLGGPVHDDDGAAGPANLRVAGRPAHLTDRRATGDCAAIGGDREILVRTEPDATGAHPVLRISACLEGPDTDQPDHTFRQLLQTIAVAGR